MKPFFIPFFVMIFFCSCAPSAKYYVVRHAEKASNDGTMMSSDPELSEPGKQRAEELSRILADQKVTRIFVTNTIRSRSTAAPTAGIFHLNPEVYSAASDSSFLLKLSTIKGSALIVGHSNTVDDLVNNLMGTTYIRGDLSEKTFDRLYIITRKKGRFTIEEKIYGVPTPD
ncbi:MAG: histidine phosphatase family protein [Chitinophagaceae bacterium]